MLASAVFVIFTHAFWLRAHDKQVRPQLAWGRQTLAGGLVDLTLPEEDRQGLRRLPIPVQVQLFTDVLYSLGGAQRTWLLELAKENGLLAWAEARSGSCLSWRRLQGLRLLAALGSGNIDVLSLLANPRTEFQSQGAELAVDHPTPGVIDTLLAMASGASSVARFAAQDSLLRMGNVVVEPLATYLSTHSGAEAVGALEVAVGLADPQFLAASLRLSQDGSPRVRAVTAALLGHLGGREAVEELRRLLNDAVPDVRSAAASAMGRLNHWPAAPAVAKLMVDTDWTVRKQAVLALDALGAPGKVLLRRSLSGGSALPVTASRHELDHPRAVEAVGGGE